MFLLVAFVCSVNTMFKYIFLDLTEGLCRHLGSHVPQGEATGC